MNAAQDSRLAELTQAATRADLDADIHHGACRQWAKMEECASCNGHEDEVIRTDKALWAWFSQLRQEAS